MSITPSEVRHIAHKKSLVHKLLQEGKRMAILHKKRSLKYKRLDDLLETLIITFSSITLSSIILNNRDNENYFIVSTIFSSLSTVLSAFKRSYNVGYKWAESKRIYSQLNDLNRDITITLAKNHLTTNDIDVILQDLDNRISLIYDSSPLIYSPDPDESARISCHPKKNDSSKSIEID